MTRVTEIAEWPSGLAAADFKIPPKRAVFVGVVVSASSGANAVPTITSGRIFGIDYGAGDVCILTIWRDGRVMDFGPIEDFDENGNRKS